MDIIELQCCNYYSLLSDYSSKFQSFVTMFHYKSVRMQEHIKVDELNVS